MVRECFLAEVCEREDTTGVKSRHPGPVTDILARERGPSCGPCSASPEDIIIQETHVPSSAHVRAQGWTATNLWGLPDTAGTCALVQLSFVPGQQLFYYGARTWPAGVRKSMYDQFGGLPKDLEMEHDYDPKVTFVCMRERVASRLVVHFAAAGTDQARVEGPDSAGDATDTCMQCTANG